MKNISLYENFIGDYSNLVNNYRDFQKKYKSDTIDLWNKYRDIINDIFSEMYHEHKIQNDYFNDNRFHSVEGSNYNTFLNYVDALFIEHFGDIEFFNEKLSRNPLQFKSDSSNIDKLIEDTIECVSKFNMIKDSFELKIQFGHEGNWTGNYDNIDSLKTKILLDVKKRGGSDIIVRFYLKLVK
jgi:hypothetical protein